MFTDTAKPNVRSTVAWLVSGFLLLSFVYLYQRFESCPIAVSGLLSCNLTPAWTALFFAAVAAILAIIKPTSLKLAAAVSRIFLTVAIVYVLSFFLSDVIYSLGNSWTIESLLDIGVASLGLLTLVFNKRPWPVLTGILAFLAVIWVAFIYLLLLG